MAIRTSAARSVLLYLKMGMPIAEALDAVATDLHDATWFYKGRVTIYAFDRQEQPEVLTYTRAEGTSPYWLWTDAMSQPEKRQGAVRVGNPDLL
jgi:L-asparaginase